VFATPEGKKKNCQAVPVPNTQKQQLESDNKYLWQHASAAASSTVNAPA